ncbi:helix-turn-helix transcriptional regulator [Kaistella sp. DKR-2]|nr:helix-turn-helix transcriptional regulator [Kaistella soli]
MQITRATISKRESGDFNGSIDYLSKFASLLDFEIYSAAFSAEHWIFFVCKVT